MGSHGQRPQGHSQPRVVSAKKRCFGEVCAPSIRTRENSLKRGFRSDKKENFFIKRTVQHWQRLPRVWWSHNSWKDLKTM